MKPNADPDFRIIPELPAGFRDRLHRAIERRQGEIGEEAFDMRLIFATEHHPKQNDLIMQMVNYLTTGLGLCYLANLNIEQVLKRWVELMEKKHPELLEFAVEAPTRGAGHFIAKAKKWLEDICNLSDGEICMKLADLLASEHAAPLRALAGRYCWLQVAMNDDHGVPTKHAQMIEIDGDALRQHCLTLHPRFMDAFARITWQEGKPGWIRIAGIKIDALNPTFHVGNIHWNRWRVRADDLWRLITHPRFTKWFQLDSGDSALWEAYEKATAAQPQPEGSKS